MDEKDSLDLIFGINPVREALRAGLNAERIYISKTTGPAAALAMEWREKGCPVQTVDNRRMDQLCGLIDGKAANHQGIILMPAPLPYYEWEDLLAEAEAKGRPPLLVLLDGITDPHNLGAILRSAEAMGAHGVIVPKRRSVGLNMTAFRASSGAAAHIKVARVTNLRDTMEALKQRGFWLAGADAGQGDCRSADLKGPLVLCIGGEGQGLSRLVRESCDFLVGIPLLGKTESLNASCAAAVLLYEIMMQRREGVKDGGGI